MPSYFACQRLHEFDDEPIVIYEEIDANRMEMRKIHGFRDGSFERSDRVSDYRTSLSQEALPSDEDIQAQAEFTVPPLSAKEFEAVWARCRRLAR